MIYICVQRYLPLRCAMPIYLLLYAVYLSLILLHTALVHPNNNNTGNFTMRASRISTTAIIA
jgi:hypothetical protein